METWNSLSRDASYFCMCSITITLNRVMKFATCTERRRRRTLGGLQECNGHNSYIVAFQELISLTSVFFSKDQVATGAFLDIEVHHEFKVQRNVILNFDSIYL